MTELGGAPQAAGNPGQPEQAGGCAHHWVLRKAQPAPAPYSTFGNHDPYTLVLGQCTQCGEPETWLLPGEWTLEDITRGSL